MDTTDTQDSENRALYSLFGEALDGVLTEERRAILERELASNASSRRLWFEFCDVECGLRALRGEVTQPRPLRELDASALSESIKSGAFSPAWPQVLWAAAAVLVFGVSILHGPLRSEQEPVLARFGEIREALWASPEDVFQQGDLVRAGQTLELLSGSAVLKFQGGASVVLHAPAIFQATAENEGFLKFGNISATAAGGAGKGFTVQTPTARIVDVGTEFTASTAADGESHVEVKSGEVFVHLPWREGAKRLVGGETLSTEGSSQRVTVRVESGDGTGAFRLPSIESPFSIESQQSQKALSSARLLGGESRSVAPVLSRGEDGRILMDLGRSIAVTKINAYSWGKGGFFESDRVSVAQNFELYGSNSSEVPTAVEDLAKQGWELIGRVDSDNYFGKSVLNNKADQQASSFTSSSGCLGQFRFLLCVPIRRTSDLAVAAARPGMNLFDVYAQPWTF